MKHEKQQRFSIRKYAVGAASVLIGFAFQARLLQPMELLLLLQKTNRPSIRFLIPLNHPKIGLRKHLKQSFNQKLQKL